MKSRGTLVFALIAMLAVCALLLAAGCGGSKESADTKTGEDTGGAAVEKGKGSGEEGLSVVGTYVSAEGKSIVLKEDHTFTTDAWASKKGTYVLNDGEAGKWVQLNFDDGSSVKMSVMIAMDEVAAIVDNETATQFTKQ